MTLKEINKIYNSDKGVTHNYLELYEELFYQKKEHNINLLEIGVLFGNSLKLWHDYFINGKIYGIDDFSQSDGQDFYDFQKVDSNQIINDLKKFERIELVIANCENERVLNDILNNLKFDIIIDDASHKLTQQKNNYNFYNKFLKEDGIYVCEDVQTNYDSDEIINYVKTISPNKKVELYCFDIEERKDDRIIVVK